MPWPRIPRWTTLRQSLRMARDPIGNLDRLLAAHGDTVRLYLGGVRDSVTTRDPALTQHILPKNHRRYVKSDLTHGLLRYLGRGLVTDQAPAITPLVTLRPGQPLRLRLVRR